MILQGGSMYKFKSKCPRFDPCHHWGSTKTSYELDLWDQLNAEVSWLKHLDRQYERQQWDQAKTLLILRSLNTWVSSSDKSFRFSLHVKAGFKWGLRFKILCSGVTHQPFSVRILFPCQMVQVVMLFSCLVFLFSSFCYLNLPAYLPVLIPACLPTYQYMPVSLLYQ